MRRASVLDLERLDKTDSGGEELLQLVVEFRAGGELPGCGH